MWRTLTVALLGLALAAGAATGSAPKRTISITSVTAQGSAAVVKVKITGWKMYPRLVGKKKRSLDGGHWHIFVDGKYNGFSANPSTGRTTQLADGKHVVRVELANNDHSPLRPPVRSRSATVTIAVAVDPPAGGSDPPPEPDYGPGYG